VTSLDHFAGPIERRPRFPTTCERLVAEHHPDRCASANAPWVCRPSLLIGGQGSTQRASQRPLAASAADPRRTRGRTPARATSECHRVRTTPSQRWLTGASDFASPAYASGSIRPRCSPAVAARESGRGRRGLVGIHSRILPRSPRAVATRSGAMTIAPSRSVLVLACLACRPVLLGSAGATIGEFAVVVPAARGSSGRRVGTAAVRTDS
jgi:hypothetical protein